MIVLKSQQFDIHKDVTKFVSKNNIKREDILNIFSVTGLGGTSDVVIFFYGDSETTEITKGFFGW